MLKCRLRFFLKLSPIKSTYFKFQIASPLSMLRFLFGKFEFYQIWTIKVRFIVCIHKIWKHNIGFLPPILGMVNSLKKLLPRWARHQICCPFRLAGSRWAIQCCMLSYIQCLYLLLYLFIYFRMKDRYKYYQKSCYVL